MKNKQPILALVLVLVIIGTTAYLLIARSSPLSSKPIESFIGGACTCPTDKVGKIESIRLYQSRGESLDQIKEDTKRVDCGVSVGCSVPRLYELYP